MFDVWRGLAVLWAVISFWMGGFGLILALPSTFHHAFARELGGWRRIVGNVLWIISGVAVLALAFDAATVIDTAVQTVEALGVWVCSLVALYWTTKPLFRSPSGRAFLMRWWPRVRMPAHLLLAAIILLGLRSTDTGWERAGVLWMAGIQILLVLWELWLRWHYRDA